MNKSNEGNSAMPSVSSERWREAQDWELGVWKAHCIPRPWWKKLLRPVLVLLGLRKEEAASEHIKNDDSNYWWKGKLDDYNDIPRDLDSVCELGCGPFTNTRLLAEGRNIKRIVCSDPLSHEYIKFPFGWLAGAYKNGHVELDNHSAEEAPFKDHEFDVVILINVLDHVYDPRKCLENACRILRPGGYFIFGQELSDQEDEKKLVHADGEIGHPIRVAHPELDSFLFPRFDKVKSIVLSREEGREPDHHYGTYLFIGKKLD